MSAFVAPLEMRDLAHRYALGVDRRDPDILCSVFTQGGGIMGFGTNPITYMGPDRLKQMLVDVGAFQRTMHNVFNQVFEQSADGAVTGQTYCIAGHILPGDDWNMLDMTMLYHDSYAQEEGRWRFAERRLEVMWVETRPVQKFTAAMMNTELSSFK